jgi:hypothetical protein
MSAKGDSLLNRLEGRKFKQPYDPPEQTKVLTISDSLIGTLESFVVFSGIPKSGKSTFIAGLISSCFQPGDQFHIKVKFPSGRKRIVLFDTEGTEYDFYSQLKRIKEFALINGFPPWFDAFNCREDSAEMIRQYIEYYLAAHPDCSVVVIDGLLDLIVDFNDVTQSRQLINWLKMLTKTYNCLIVTVLHLGKKDLNTLGHLGSMADRYAQSVLKVEKDKNNGLFVLSPAYLRSSKDFNPIAISQVNGQWMEAVIPTQQEPDKKPGKFPDEYRQQEILNLALKQPKNYKQLQIEVGELGACGSVIAKRIIQAWIMTGKIEKQQDGNYTKR